MALLMTLSWRFLPILYTRTREGEVPQLGSGPTPCRLGLAVWKASSPFERGEMPSREERT